MELEASWSRGGLGRCRWSFRQTERRSGSTPQGVGFIAVSVTYRHPSAWSPAVSALQRSSAAKEENVAPLYHVGVREGGPISLIDVIEYDVSRSVEGTDDEKHALYRSPVSIRQESPSEESCVWPRNILASRPPYEENGGDRSWPGRAGSERAMTPELTFRSAAIGGTINELN